MTRAMLFHAAGRPLEVVEFPLAEPRGGEVRVRVTCCTLCRSDLHTHAGRRVEPSPTVLGHEIVGRIEAFGPDAPRHDANGTPVEVGTRVTWAVAVGCGGCFFCQEDLPQKCERPYKYGHRQTDPARPDGGGLADRITLVPNTVWYRVPDDLPDAVAAQANCATATAAAVVRAAGPVGGRSVLVLGAGVLGLTACAMARSAGAERVLASDPRADGRERAGRFGATHAFTPDELEAGVLAATSGRGADAVLELAGTANTVEAAIKLVRVGGTVVLAGTVAPVGRVPFDPERAVRRMLSVRGVHNYHPRDLAAALAFLTGPGQAYPWESLVAGEFPLEWAERAFAAAHARPGVRVAVFPEEVA
jgi:alcohol dehydrogenase